MGSSLLDNNMIEVAAINPVASMLAIENRNLVGIAEEIKEKLAFLRKHYCIP